MSIEEQKSIESSKPISQHIAAEFWKRGKKMVLLYQIGQTLILTAAIIIGVSLTIERRVAEILANPKRTTRLEQQDSAKFQFVDSALDRHNGLLTTILLSVDTNVKIAVRHSRYLTK